MSRAILALLLTIIVASPAIGQQLSYEVFPIDISPSGSDYQAFALVISRSTNQTWQCVALFRKGQITDTHCDRHTPANLVLNQNTQIRPAPVSLPPYRTIRTILTAGIFWFIDQANGTVSLCNFALKPAAINANPQRVARSASSSCACG